VVMTQPHSAHLRKPPERSHDLRPALEGLRFFTLSRGASTHPHGMQEAGTGTAIHSSFGLSAAVYL
jgi:hypothetical protein